MAAKSAGILVYRRIKGRYEVLLAHPGGPFWAKKDLNSWSVPKGEYSDDEDASDCRKERIQRRDRVSMQKVNSLSSMQ